MTILHALTAANLAEICDGRTLARAMSYVHECRLSEPVIGQLTDDILVASAAVTGARSVPYVTRLHAELTDDELWVTSTCTCPAHLDCKHGVALALVLGGRAATASPVAPWQHQLDRVLDELTSAEERGDPARVVPLALEIWIDDTRRHYRDVGREGPGLRVRPVRRGR